MKINNISKSITNILGDQDLISTTINQGFKLISGPILLILLPLFISSEAQGYWFSFISISALSVLADLGFTIIISQFSAHEYAFLKIKNGIIVPKNKNDLEHLIKLASLLRFAINWSKKIMLISFPVILFIGGSLFISKKENVAWTLPWIIYVAGAALTFSNSVILSFLEGCDNVAKIQRIRFYSLFLNFLILFLLLMLRTNLMALAGSIVMSSLLTSIIVYQKFRLILIQLWRLSTKKKYNWLPEFWRFFKKYSISVATGYFAIQIYTPLAFKFYGPIDAGKVGLTLSLGTAIFSVSNIWFQSVAPKINILTSQKNWMCLNKLFIERLTYATITYLIICTIFVLTFLKIKDSSFSEITNRFLPLRGIIILFLHWLTQIPIWAMALFLRAHKKEPFLLTSIIITSNIILLTFISIKLLSVEFIYIGLLGTSIISLPFIIAIFNKKRILWSDYSSFNINKH